MSDLMNKMEKEVRVFKTYVETLWKGEKPLAKLFGTGSRGYLYDTGTNKILDERALF